MIREKVAQITRKHPGLVDGLRRVLPLSMKRKLGAMLLPGKTGGTTTAKDGRSFVTIPDRLFLQVVYDGVFEPSLSNFILGVLDENDICVDIGSNFGWFATLMAGKARRVIAYEPANRIHTILRENIKINGYDNIELRKKAVGREAGTADFVIEGDEARESALGYVSVDSQRDGNDTVDSVEIVRLDDDLAAETGSIALIKLDAEGFEHYAVEGGERLFGDANPPILITEANRETLERSGTSREAFCATLESFGYTLFGMKADGTLYRDNGKAPALACIPAGGRYAKRISAE